MDNAQIQWRLNSSLQIFQQQAPLLPFFWRRIVSETVSKAVGCLHQNPSYAVTRIVALCVKYNEASNIMKLEGYNLQKYDST